MKALLALPSHYQQRLVAALRSGQLVSPYSELSLRGALGTSDGLPGISAALKELEALGISGQGSAAWIESLSYVSASTRKPDIVWSGPEVAGMHARDTRQVYHELLSSAESSVWVSTYAFFDGPKAFEVLAKRMDSHSALSATLLLNIQRSKGDTSAPNEIVRRFADRFWSKDWPGSSRPRVFYDPRALEVGTGGSVLHAKAVVVDNETAFITSANLTEAALDRNIELGLLVRDRQVAMTVAGHFQVLIDQQLLKMLPRE